MRRALCLAAALLTGVLQVSNSFAGVDTAPLGPDGSTPLQWAVFNGNLAGVKRLLTAGADVKATNAYGVDALQLAADFSNTAVIKLLLTAGANANSANPDGETPLHLVARTGNVEAAKMLLKAGARVDARERFGEQTPLMWATARRHPNMVELLASKGADVNARSAIREYQRVATAESRAKQLDRGGLTPLMYAAREDCRECIPILLKHHADVTVPEPAGMTPLHIALLNGNWDIARRFIEAGADVNQWDRFGQGPLSVAIGSLGMHGSNNPLDRDSPNQASGPDVVNMLLERGANPNQQLYYRPPPRTTVLTIEVEPGRGTTPFLLACATGDIGLVKLLLSRGANPKLATADGQGPIMFAIRGRVMITREAADAGNAASYADSKVELIKLLASAGADVNLMAKRHYLQRTRGGSAMHYAVRAGSKQAMAALQTLGIDLNAKDEDGLTALDYAMGRGYVPFTQLPKAPNKDLADTLRSWGANVELAKTPDWPPAGPPQGTAVFDAVVWPVDPVGP